MFASPAPEHHAVLGPSSSQLLVPVLFLLVILYYLCLFALSCLFSPFSLFSILFFFFFFFFFFSLSLSLSISLAFFLSSFSHRLATTSGAAGAGVVRKRKKRVRDYHPSPWEEYFDTMRMVSAGDGTFRVFEKGPPPAPATDAAAAVPMVVLLHGCGLSALSFALLAAELVQQVECHVVAYDSRGHGATTTSADADLSLDTQCRDVVNVVTAVIGDAPPPPIVVMGHRYAFVLIYIFIYFEQLC